MISTASLLGAILLGVGAFAALKARRLPGTEAAAGHHGQDEFPCMKEPAQILPNAISWCAILEALQSCAVFCLDESLCLVAQGPCAAMLAVSETARSAQELAQDPPHLVDIVPHDAAGLILELAAGARRGCDGSDRVPWDERRTAVRALPFAEKGVLLLIELPDVQKRPLRAKGAAA